MPTWQSGMLTFVIALAAATSRGMAEGRAKTQRELQRRSIPLPSTCYEPRSNNVRRLTLLSKRCAGGWNNENKGRSIKESLPEVDYPSSVWTLVRDLDVWDETQHGID
jgi:hypothetical protein